MTAPLPYCTLFVGRLVQESGFSTGGSSVQRHLVDDALARDGLGRLTLRGTGLAGALLATARKASAVPDSWRTQPSRWQVHNSHPDAEQNEPEMRQGVGLRQDTGAAATGVLYDIEVTPRGTRWPFLLEVDTTDADGRLAEAIAAAALLEWLRGRCWIGRDVARGLGWMRLADLRVARLTTAALTAWPDSGRPDPWELASALADTEGATEPVVVALAALAAAAPAPARSWHYIDLSGQIEVGPHRDDDQDDDGPGGYGLDALSVGGHALAPGPGPAAILAPSGMSRARRDAAFDADMTVLMSRGPEGLEPLLTGAGLRGPLRHLVSRLRRGRSRDVADPNLRDEPNELQPDPAATAAETGPACEDQGLAVAIADPVGKLFGTIDRSARLLVRDAVWEAGGEPVLALLQHHAEDEFSAGVFEDGKFDRMFLLQGRFAWRIVLETTDVHLLRWVRRALPVACSIGRAGHIPLGGAKWRGGGWVRWDVTAATIGIAGSDPVELEYLA